MNLYITKLKIVLQSKIFLLTIFIFCIIYCFICIKFNCFNSKYNVNTKNVQGIVKNIKKDNDKINIYIDDLLIYIDNYENFDISIGDYVKVYGNFKVPESENNFYSFNYKNYLYSKKIHYIVYASSIDKIYTSNNFIYKVKKFMINRIDMYNTKDYLSAFILGDSSLIEDSVIDNYKSNGIIHLFSISGMHVSLISCALLFILNKLFKKGNFKFIFVIVILLFYSFIAGFCVSVVRAVLLFALCTINKILKLNIKNYYLLLYLMCICLIYNPFYIYNTGFEFSYVISYFLMRFSYGINNYNSYLKKLFITSLISFISSIPILICTSFNINLLTPIFNLLFVPFISFVIFPLSLLTFIFHFLEPIYSILLNLMEYMSNLFSNISYFNITLSHISIISIILYYIVIYFVINKICLKEYKYIVILFIIIFFHHNIRYFDFSSKISFINIGQGDCILITLKHNQGNILIDCGQIVTYNSDGIDIEDTANDVIIPYLKSHGINKLDCVVITHGDTDHIGSINDIINNIDVKKVILNSGHNNDSENYLINNLKHNKISYYNLSKGSIKFGRYIFYFINDVDKNSENEDSLVVYTKIDGVSILLMGDSGFDTEKYILNTYNIKNVDILKVGHHGSKYSTSKEFVDKINPKYSVILVGKNNKYNHPDPNVISRLSDSTTYLTSINGSIEFILKRKILVKSVR